MTDNRAQLLKKLKSLLQNKGLYCENIDLFSAYHGLTETDFRNFAYLKSDDQIEKMIEVLQTQKFKCSYEFTQYCKDNGLFETAPAVIDDGGVPSLVLGWGRYLHWFRGFYFQISATHDGRWTVYSGADRMDHAKRDLSEMHYYTGYDYTDAKKFIMIACMLPVLLYEDNGRKILEEHSDIVDEFLSKTEYYERLKNVKYEDFKKYLDVQDWSKQPVVTDEDLVIRIMHNGFNYGLLTVAKDVITFTVHLGRDHYQTLRLNIPEWLFLKDEYGECLENVTRFYIIFVRAILALGGFVADYVCMYPAKSKRRLLQTMEYDLPKTASSWEEIEDYLKEFLGDEEQPATESKVF